MPCSVGPRGNIFSAHIRLCVSQIQVQQDNPGGLLPQLSTGGHYKAGLCIQFADSENPRASYYLQFITPAF